MNQPWLGSTPLGRLSLLSAREALSKEASDSAACPCRLA